MRKKNKIKNVVKIELIEYKYSLVDQYICKAEVNVEITNNAVESVEISVSDEEVKDVLDGKDDEEIVDETQLSSRTQTETEDKYLKSSRTENEESIVNSFEVASCHGVVDDNSPKDLESDRAGKNNDIVDEPKQFKETYSATADEEEKQKKEFSEDVEIECKDSLKDQGICMAGVNVNAVESVEITVSDEEVEDFLVGKDDEDIVEETQQLSSRTQIETEDPSLKSYKTENEESIVNILDFAVASSYGVVDDKSSKDLELDRSGKPTDIVDLPKQLEETYSATADEEKKQSELESKDSLEDQGICKSEVNVVDANNAVNSVEITVSDEQVKDEEGLSVIKQEHIEYEVSPTSQKELKENSTAIIENDNENIDEIPHINIMITSEDVPEDIKFVTDHKTSIIKKEVSNSNESNLLIFQESPILKRK